MNANSRPSVSPLALGSLLALLAAPWAAERATAAASVGLSTVQARLLDNPPIAEWTPEAGDFFADVLATGDFNGDGADDLAVGIPNDDGLNGIAGNSGLVVVWYGTPGAGLQSVVWNVLRLPLVQENARFGAALAAGDFDGDGFDDLAVGAPGFDFTSGNQDTGNWGKVMIHHGSATGLEEIGSETLQSHGFGGGEQHYGQSLAAGDFNGDFFADLAIGAPQGAWNLGGGPGVPGGIVYVEHGPFPDPEWYYLSQHDAEIPDDFEANDQFGASLAVGNFNRDGVCSPACADYDDLAIGVPGEDVGGKVLVLFGSQWSLLAGSAHWFGEGELGGTATATAGFGSVLTTGDFDGDLADDLIISAPFKSIAGAGAAGQVTALFGSVTAINGSWFDLEATRWLTQTTFYGAGANAASDQFGWSLASGDFDHDGAQDLAVGHIGEDVVPGGNNLGAFTILTGSATNPRGPGRTFRFFGAGYAGMPIPWADWDNFGWALASGDFDGDRHDDLVVGVPFHDAAGVGSEVGAAVVLRGAAFADSFDWDGSLLFWSEVSP